MSEAATALPPDRMVGFQESIPLGFKNYFKFEGRSSRGAYWYWALFVVVASLGFGFVDGILFGSSLATPISTLFGLVTLIPGISIGIRRLHDIGKSGWWTLIALTGIGILLLLYWGAQPGERSTNTYGSDSETGK